MTASPTVLVTGGAGYVGSHVVLALREAGVSAAPPALVARAARIREVLAWRPALDDLNLIVRSALAWERRMAAERGRNSLERV